MARIVTILKSKTVWGALAAAVSYLTAQPHVGLHQVVIAAGTVLSAVGIRDAITKATAPE